METLDLAHEIVDIMDSRLGSDIVLLDLTEVTLIADYFIIASGDSERQLSALSDAIESQLKEHHGIRPLSSEGKPSSGWMLIDLGTIVVHLFTPAQRDFYALEELWKDARTVMRMA